MPRRLTNESDAWFWSPEWQRAEAEALKDIDTGDVTEFDSVDDLLAHLNGGLPPRRPAEGPG